MYKMNFDDYNEVINGENTYKEIASRLKMDRSVLIGWTDELYTHFDILFSINPCKYIYNYNQFGLNGSELFVSIIGIGAFGFKLNKNGIHCSYIAEKLNLPINETIEKLSDLINNVIKEYN